MNKTYKYTILTMLLALAFSFGSIAGMKVILHARERQLLSESGRCVIEVPVQEWENNDVLTTKQVEEVVRCWEEAEDVVMHDPAAGQVSMGEALVAGTQWLVQMGLEKDRQETLVDEVSSYLTLHTPMTEKTEKEAKTAPQFSFWKIQFDGQGYQAFLSMNAITGKVWAADLVLYENMPEEMPRELLKRFVKLSGLYASGDIKSLSDSEAILGVIGSDMYARMGFRHGKTGYLSEGSAGKGLLDFKDKRPDREHVNLLFWLETGQE